jgi:hypothetical protein
VSDRQVPFHVPARALGYGKRSSRVHASCGRRDGPFPLGTSFLHGRRQSTVGISLDRNERPFGFAFRRSQNSIGLGFRGRQCVFHRLSRESLRRGTGFGNGRRQCVLRLRVGLLHGMCDGLFGIGSGFPQRQD